MGGRSPRSPQDPCFLVVGHLNKPHGTKGELFVWPLTDHPESVYAPGMFVFVADAEGEEPDPRIGSLRITAVRAFRNGFLDDVQVVNSVRGLNATPCQAARDSVPPRRGGTR